MRFDQIYILLGVVSHISIARKLLCTWVLVVLALANSVSPLMLVDICSKLWSSVWAFTPICGCKTGTAVLAQKSHCNDDYGKIATAYL